MAAARRKLSLRLTAEALQDLAELTPMGQEEAINALDDLLARPLSGELKKGLLTGARSWSFAAEEDDDRDRGRVVYRIIEGIVVVFALHCDHDEAYRRARKRAARYL